MQATTKLKTANLFQRFKNLSRKGDNSHLQKKIEPPDLAPIVLPPLKNKTITTLKSEDKEAVFECLKKLINKKLTAAKKDGLEIPVFIPPPKIKIKNEGTRIMDNIGNIFTPSYGLPQNHRDNYTTE